MFKSSIAGSYMLDTSAGVLPEKGPHLLNGKTCHISPCRINRTFSGSSLVAQDCVTPILIFKQMWYHEGIFHMKERRQNYSYHSASMCHNPGLASLPQTPSINVIKTSCWLSLVQIYISLTSLIWKACTSHKDAGIISIKHAWTWGHREVVLGPMSWKEMLLELEQKAGILNLVPSPSVVQ